MTALARKLARGSGLIGREADVAALRTLVARERLVTVVGTAGVGKTSLVRELGAAFCDLGDATDERGLVFAVARALDVALGDARRTTTAILAVGRALAERGGRRDVAARIVVLDNFEQLLRVGTPVLVRWRELAPRTVFVITSREALRLHDEVVLRLAPLPCVAVEGLSDAARLFVARWCGDAVRGSAALALVERIVRRVDGVPLAIELAAARSEVLSLTEIDRRLESSLDLLVSDRKDASPRHNTLTAAIRWSWALLTEEERRALVSLAIFRGGFSLAAAEAILAVPSALDLVSELVRKSLVQRLPHDETTGGARYALLETVRTFARTERDSQTEPLQEALYARYFVELAARNDRALAVEQANLDEAARLLVDRARAGDVDAAVAGLRLLVGLGTLRRSRYPVDRFAEELTPLVESVRPIVGTASSPGDLRPTFAAALELLAYCNLELGQTETSRALYEEALALVESANLPREHGRILLGLGRLDANLGRWTTALVHLGRAREIAAASGDEELSVLAEASLEFYGSELGPTPLTAETRAKHFFAERGDVLEAVYWGVQRARGLIDFANEEAALTELDELLRLARTHGDLRGEGLGLFGLGTAHLTLGRIDEATATLRAAVETLRLVGATRYEAYAGGFLALALDLGGDDDTAPAEEQYARSIASLERFGDRPNVALFRGYLGAMFARAGRIGEALGELGTAAEIVESRQDPMRLRLVALQRGVVELALARRAAHRGGRAEVVERLATVERALATPWERGGQTLAGEPIAWIDLSFEIRISNRLLHDALLAFRTADSGDETWSITTDVGAFRRPSGAWVSLAGRKAMQRLLRALVDQRSRDPHACLSSDALIAAGWPEERITRDAGRNRLYVALDGLRKIGLADLLERGPAGWRLRPGSRLALEAPHC